MHKPLIISQATNGKHAILYLPKSPEKWRFNMQVNPLQTNLMHLFNTEPIKTAVEGFSSEDGSFADILSEAFATTSSADKVDKANSIELLMGESDDLSGIILDAQKAELSLQLALQIRNKILDAYNDVIRMSV